MDNRDYTFCGECYANLILPYLYAKGIKFPGHVIGQPLVRARDFDESLLLTPAVSAPQPIVSSRPPRILVIEDDMALLEMLAIVFRIEFQGSTIVLKHDGLDGLHEARTHRPDVVILDLMLPGMNGIDVVNRLRSSSDVPVLMLTAKTDTVDVVLGLSSGADDYVVKPFKPKELVARIRRMLQRQSSGRWSEEIYDDGLLRLDSLQRKTFVAGSPVVLSPLEFGVLELLAHNRGSPQPLNKVLAKVWDDPTGSDKDRVKFTIARLRRKLENTELGGDAIITTRGRGYLYQPLHLDTTGDIAGDKPIGGGGYGHANRIVEALSSTNQPPRRTSYDTSRLQPP
ncbi:response regulator transcription factor [Nocardia tenerifensis]|uniref:response regulator transcription factor n=1 Tax=Nocardia tenerifensis TaxID=228006 RepID=UPI000313FAD9|nr:response regulator transcription factor [Nocardia tenerifensis]